MTRVINKDKHVVSVVIPTCGRATINLCKDALQRQTRPPDEVIIIKDIEKRGSSWARNEGIRQSSGDLIAFTDDDCIPPKDWIEKLVLAIDKYDCSGAGGTYYETDPILNYIRKQRKLPETEQIDTKGIVGLGGNVMYKQSWLEAVKRHDGYIYNEKYKSVASEDWELALRLRLRGAKLAFIPIKVTHLRQMSPILYCLTQFKRGMGVASLYLFQRSLKTDIVVHKSFIWGQEASNNGSRWLYAFWYKIIGPFDIKSFKQKRKFWLYWIGEKFQVIGFTWKISADAIRGIEVNRGSDSNKNHKEPNIGQ